MMQNSYYIINIQYTEHKTESSSQQRQQQQQVLHSELQVIKILNSSRFDLMMAYVWAQHATP